MFLNKLFYLLDWKMGSSSDLQEEPARLSWVTCDLPMPWSLSPHPELHGGLIPSSHGCMWSQWEILGLTIIFSQQLHHVWLMTETQQPCWRKELCRWLGNVSQMAFPLQGAGMGSELGRKWGLGNRDSKSERTRGMSPELRTWPLASAWSPGTPPPETDATQILQRGQSCARPAHYQARCGQRQLGKWPAPGRPQGQRGLCPPDQGGFPLSAPSPRPSL